MERSGARGAGFRGRASAGGGAALVLRIVVAALATLVATAGCGASPSSRRTADGIAGAVAPCGSGRTIGGTWAGIAAIGAVALAAAGASTPVERCAPVPGGTGASIPPAPAGGILSVTPSAWIAPEPTADPALREPGRFACTSEDGEVDVVVAESPARAIEVCRELTAQSCVCVAS